MLLRTVWGLYTLTYACIVSSLHIREDREMLDRCKYIIKMCNGLSPTFICVLLYHQSTITQTRMDQPRGIVPIHSLAVAAELTTEYLKLSAHKQVNILYIVHIMIFQVSQNTWSHYTSLYSHNKYKLIHCWSHKRNQSWFMWSREQTVMTRGSRPQNKWRQ